MHRYTQLPTSNTVGLIFTRVVDEGRYCCYLAAIHNACRPCVTVPIAQPGVVVASIIMPASPCSLQHKYALPHTVGLFLTPLGTLKMRDMKLRDMKMRHHVAVVENARHENARNAIVWNTACCIGLSIAEWECMSRQERAPDFAANCGCPICRSEITMVLRLY